MKIYQLDECINSKKLETACRDEGKCMPHRFPKAHKGKGVKDPQVLAMFFSQGKVIVTNDKAMLREHVENIPELHPGLILIKFSDECKYEIDDQESAKILRHVKSKIPNWSSLACENSIAVATEKGLEILHKKDNKLLRNEGADYSDANFADKIEAALKENSKRKPLPF